MITSMVEDGDKGLCSEFGSIMGLGWFDEEDDKKRDQKIPHWGERPLQKPNPELLHSLVASQDKEWCHSGELRV